MIDASLRLQGVEQLIDSKQYFVIHAARQSGKTTCLKDLANRLNAGGKYYALTCSLESVQGILYGRPQLQGRLAGDFRPSYLNQVGR